MLGSHQFLTAFSEYCSAPSDSTADQKCLSYDEKTAIELIGQAKNTVENVVTAVSAILVLGAFVEAGIPALTLFLTVVSFGAAT